ncbi:hypothetical protein SMONO_v1c05310 [Spiroplasma monobiae MQ-1]|uniref:Metallothionein n=1 Tax=Spiroplasma monobiae MQ-1 TaxID=1336748 RepID=A0A2K9LUS9_SPISQ|nr:hypothetical protein SMONO_v1c05310 [Spiroplasma monobiae MQ-1]
MECNKDCKDCGCGCAFDDNCSECQMCANDKNHG